MLTLSLFSNARPQLNLNDCFLSYHIIVGCDFELSHNHLITVEIINVKLINVDLSGVKLNNVVYC